MYWKWNRRWLLRALLGGLLLPFTAASQAIEPLPGLQLHGFLSQGFNQSSDNSFFGSSEGGTFDFTELGLNASWRAHPRLLLSAQLLSRNAGKMYDGNPELDYGLADFTLLSRDDLQAGLRIGRYKNPYGLYNDTRDVPSTRPGILLPQSIYFDKVRNLILHADGAQLYGQLATDTGDWSLQLGVGQPSYDSNVEYAYFGTDLPGEVDNGEPLALGRLLYEWRGGTLRGGLTLGSGSIDYRRGAVDPVGAGEVDILLKVLSLEYNGERLSLTGEYMQQEIDWDGFGPLYDTADRTGEGYYLQAGYRLRHDLSVLLRYDVSHLDRDHPDGSNVLSQPGNLPVHSQFAYDWTAGLSWQPQPDWMLRAELHHVHGNSWVSGRETPLGQRVANWQLFSLQLSYQF